MPASPARIPMMTSDGVALSRVDSALRTAQPNASDENGTEREYFFDTQADTDAMIDEYWNWRKTPGRVHEAVETDSGFGLGTTVAVSPAIPQFTVVDDGRGINALARVRAFAVDYTKERYSVELLG